MSNGTHSDLDIVVCSEPRALALDAAYRVAALSAAATRAGRSFSLALAGGKTPAMLYRFLASDPFVGAIDWSGVHLFFGDERCVPTDSPLSNFRMANETLIEPLRLAPGNVHRIEGEQTDPERAAQDYASDLSAFFGSGLLPRFDLILLGMGSDGHCASLFPNMPALNETSRSVVVSAPGLEPFVPRVTLTVPVLVNAANIIFMVAGADKAETAARVLSGPPDPARLPSQSARPSDGSLTWILDRAAAAGLTS